MPKFQVKAFEKLTYIAPCEAVIEAESAEAVKDMIAKTYEENPWLGCTFRELKATQIVEKDDYLDDLELLPDLTTIQQVETNQ